MNPAEMFDALDPRDLDGAARVACIWRAIMPVPADVPGTFPPHRLGKPSSCWVYRDAHGRRLFVVCRFDKPDGEKEVLPLTYCEGPGGKREWRWQAPPISRPLYGLDRLAQHPESPVIVAEGEKSADAAAALFPDYVAVTSQGGASAADKSAWEPLRGRSVTVWPDHDEGGARYATAVVRLAYEAGAASVSLVEVPGAFPEKWDVADPLPDGWEAEGLRALLDSVRPGEQIATGPAWPEPDRSLVSDDRDPPPRFDWDVVPAAWRAWLAETAEACGAPVDYVFAGLLAIGSAALGNARCVMPKGGWVEPPHVWLVLVGNPSSGKTPSLRPFIEAAREIERSEEPAHAEALALHARDVESAKATEERWREDVRAAVKQGTDAPDRPAAAVAPDAPAPPRLVLADATTEQLCRILAGNPKGLALVRDELAGLIGGFDRYGGAGADRGFYLETWNGGRYVVDRVKDAGKPLRIPFASLAIIGGAQPDRLEEVLSGTDDGLAARFLYVWPEPVPPSRSTGNGWQDRADLLRLALARLRGLELDTGQDGDLRPRLVELGPGAQDVLHAIQCEIFAANRDDRGLMAGWRGKNNGRALRIALALEFLAWAATGGPEPAHVSEASLRAAADYLDYATSMMDRVLGVMALDQATRHAASVARWIMRERPAEVNGRELSKLAGFSRLRAPSVRATMFDRLTEAGWLRPIEGKGGRGRKPDTWTVNPLLLPEV